MTEHEADREAARLNLRLGEQHHEWYEGSVFYVPVRTPAGDWTVERRQDKPAGRIQRIVLTLLSGPWR